MVNDSADLYGGADPLDLAIYRVAEAARYLSMPSSTLRAWTFGQRNRGRDFARVIDPQDARSGLLSFRNLVEAHVLSSLRIQHGVPLPRIRRAIQYLRRQTGKQRPLVELPLLTDGADLFVRASEGILNVSQGGQFSLEKILQAYLRRVETDEHGVVRLYPFTRKWETIELLGLAEQPKAVVIDPRISFGRPVIARTNIRTSVVAERYLAGESIEDLARDYGRPSLEIEEAIRCEIPFAA